MYSFMHNFVTAIALSQLCYSYVTVPFELCHSYDIVVFSI